MLGVPYDSDKGRVLAGQITSLMCGEAYRMSAVIASHKGPFAGYYNDREGTLKVLSKHLDSAERLFENSQRSDMDDKYLETASRLVWHEAKELAEEYGVKNSQVTVLAPTGTISFLMDCDTTGIEPELALVKYKKLVGGGTLKLVNNQIPIDRDLNIGPLIKKQAIGNIAASYVGSDISKPNHKFFLDVYGRR
jgi:ribonucleoside-diphosphate reductase alpha chain